jgi:hypothetical protein
VSRYPQFPQHLFGVDKAAGLKVLLRGQNGSMKGSTILRVEPVARIEWQEINLSPLREFRGFIYDESPMMNAGLNCHGGRIP